MIFLQEMAKYYQIIIFTASIQRLADLILNKIDPKRTLIKHRLYRQHTIMTPICAIKDLDRLGRPLEKTLIIDNRRQNFDRQPDNGIKCSTWTGNPNDRQLTTFKNFLQTVTFI